MTNVKKANVIIKNKDLIVYSIIGITLLVLIILCITGNSFKNVRDYYKQPDQEHFFSNIKKWINGGDDDDVSPSNISPTTPSINIPEHIPSHIQNQDGLNNTKVIDTTNILKQINQNRINKPTEISIDTPAPIDKPWPIGKPGSVDKPAPIDKPVVPSFDKFNLQFFDSTDNPDEKDYLYTGAEIGLRGANVTCGNSKSTAEKATGVAILDRDGSISDIKVLYNGRGYKLPPTVKIIGGGGSGCRAKAVIDDHTKVVHFEILDGGNGYISTPNIEIEEPSQNKLCKLYIKK